MRRVLNMFRDAVGREAGPDSATVDTTAADRTCDAAPKSSRPPTSRYVGTRQQDDRR